MTTVKKTHSIKSPEYLKNLNKKAEELKKLNLKRSASFEHYPEYKIYHDPRQSTLSVKANQPKPRVNPKERSLMSPALEGYTKPTLKHIPLNQICIPRKVPNMSPEFGHAPKINGHSAK